MSGYHYVRPYRRQNGTLVRGHMRRNPGPRIGAAGVLFFVLILAIFGGVGRGHASGTGIRSGVGTTQHQTASPAKTP